MGKELGNMISFDPCTPKGEVKAPQPPKGEQKKGKKIVEYYDFV